MHYEYLLILKAIDNGKPPLSSTLTLHIMVVMADNAPPRYLFFFCLLNNQNVHVVNLPQWTIRDKWLGSFLINAFI